MAGAVRDRSADNKMHTLGLFSDLNYTTINDPYDDVALRRMLSNRLGEANVSDRSLGARVRESVSSPSARPATHSAAAHGRWRTTGSRAVPPMLTWCDCWVFRRAPGPRAIQVAHAQNCAAVAADAGVEAQLSVEGVVVSEARHNDQRRVLLHNRLEIGSVLAQVGQGVGV